MGVKLQHGDDDLSEVHEINVTPFIDVILVLLIIFMVAAPLATVDIAVNLPAASVEPQPRPDKPVFLTVKPDLTLTIGEETIARPALAEALGRAVTAGNKEQAIFLRADKTVPYGEIMEVMNLLRGAGYLKVALVALEKSTVSGKGGCAVTPAVRREAARWACCAAIVLAAHGGIAAIVTSWSASDPSGAATAILIEMAPLATESAAEQANLPIAPPQEEQIEPEPEPKPESEPDKVEPEPERKVVEVTPVPDPPPPPPPQVEAAVTLPPEVKKEEKKPPKKKAAIATAHERAERIAPRQVAATTGVVSTSQSTVASYAASIIRPHILRYYSFPASARSKNQEGVVVVTFSITRQGTLTSRRVSRSSGHSELDGEALATLQRAQPYPRPPPDLTQQVFVFTLPMRYNIR